MSIEAVNVDATVDPAYEALSREEASGKETWGEQASHFGRSFVKYTSQFGHTFIQDWKANALLAAVVIQTTRTVVEVLTGGIFAFVANGVALGGLVAGYYAMTEYKKLQTLEASTESLQTTNEELNQKLDRLEKATSTLVDSIARFDTTTALYLNNFSAAPASKENQMQHLTHATEAFARLFEEESLADLWKETIEAVRSFEQAKVEYQEIKQAITVERAALSKLNEALSKTEVRLADQVSTLRDQSHDFDHLYKEYHSFLTQLLKEFKQLSQSAS